MKISRDEKKIEALRRMAEIGISPRIIERFEKKDKVVLCDPKASRLNSLRGRVLDCVEQFEYWHDALVYMVVRNYYTYDNRRAEDNYLYVSDNREEWPNERKTLKERKIRVYVHDDVAPDLSRIKSVNFELTAAGGLAKKEDF